MSSVIMDNNSFLLYKPQELFELKENQANEEELFDKIIFAIALGGDQSKINQEFLKCWIKYTQEQQKTIVQQQKTIEQLQITIEQLQKTVEQKQSKTIQQQPKTIQQQKMLEEENERLKECIMKCNMQKRQEMVGNQTTKDLLKGSDLSKFSTQNFQQITMIQQIENLKKLLEDKIQKINELETSNLALAHLEVQTCITKIQAFTKSLDQYSIDLFQRKIITSSGFDPDLSRNSQTWDNLTQRQQINQEQLQSPLDPDKLQESIVLDSQS
ncbi:unnamed protein product [Paramecium sonneborni]|uniref:Uncharacterized protein n=1 Tax=Paramecium sonneborni TaxID=65129 RepID=A0A8S1KPM0_9CILI|nr:unnamed protein product [Paramecium sonneborni]